MVAVAQPYKAKRDTGLKNALVFEDGYENWGWWCPRCTRPGVRIGQEQFGTRDGARKAAVKHEKRRGH